MTVEETESHPAVASAVADVTVSTNSARNAASHSLHWPQNHELAESSIPDLLAVVSRNALIVIPSERCVVFMYDKTSNLLTAQVSCGGRVVGDPSEGSTESQIPVADGSDDEELSFPPVMGLVSACFLQRRCLRMQEPNQHKAFHREYDVPKDMVMDSIIVAPVTLHHRTVGVIELINRIDPEAPLASPVHTPHDESPRKERLIAPGDEENEVQLTRTKAVKRERARIGFSAKDEQKMIQFTSHVAQLLDNKLKLLAQIESAAKFREEQAKTAMELLEMMNHKLEYRTVQDPIEPPPRMLKRRSSLTFHATPIEWTPEQLAKEETSIAQQDEQVVAADEARDLVLSISDVDMMKVLVGISRTQAAFRGHHLRKVHRLSEALQQHRIARRRAKSALVIQRATRRFFARRWRKHRRNAIWTIVRAIKSYRMRAALAQRVELRKRQKRKRSIAMETKPREGAHHKLVESDVHTFRERYASAIKIQQQFRGHKARKQIAKIVGFKDLTKGLKNIVRLQSILRGTIARKHVEVIREEKRASRAANLVCLRLAATDHIANDTTASEPPAHLAPNSRDCLYPLPAASNGAYIAANRAARSWVDITAEATSDPRTVQVRLQSERAPFSNALRRRRLVQASCPINQETIEDELGLSPLSRPLAASPSASPRMLYERAPLPPPDSVQMTRTELARMHPQVIFETDPKRGKRCAPGVQHADDWLPRRPRLPVALRRYHTLDEREAEDRASSNHEPSFSRIAHKHAFRSAAGTALPRLAHPPSPRSSHSPRSNQLQVCFLPASTTLRPPTRPTESHTSSRPPSPPKTTRSALGTASASPRRPLATR